MKKIRMAFFALATLTLLAISIGCSPRKGASAKASDSSSAKSEEEKESEKNTVSNDGANKPLTVTGEITGSDVFIKGRTVEIWAKWCCDHEVTQAEYQSVMGENPSKFSGSDKPVESVSWYDAIMYCNKKSVASGRTPCYKVNEKPDTSQWGYTPHGYGSISGIITCDFTADGYRLPTEAEWEYFARGGNTSNIGQTEYSGSNDIEAVAWYDENAYNGLTSDDANYGTHQVKTKAPNALGLYDMSGNVCEWCWDWYSYNITKGAPSSGDESGASRVNRGGSWFDYHGCGCTVSYRDSDYPGGGDYYCGFRVVSSRSE